MEMAWMRQGESLVVVWPGVGMIPDCYGMGCMNPSLNLNHCVSGNGVTFPSLASQPLGIWPLALSWSSTLITYPSAPIAQDLLKYLTLLKYLKLLHVSLTFYRSQCCLIASLTSNPLCSSKFSLKIGSFVVFSLNLIYMPLGSPGILFMPLLWHG